MPTLKELRLEKGMSVYELAKRSGVDTSYIHRLEAGKKNNPSVKVIDKLAKALGVNASELAEAFIQNHCLKRA